MSLILWVTEEYGDRNYLHLYPHDMPRLRLDFMHKGRVLEGTRVPVHPHEEVFSDCDARLELTGDKDDTRMREGSAPALYIADQWRVQAPWVWVDTVEHGVREAEWDGVVISLDVAGSQYAEWSGGTVDEEGLINWEVSGRFDRYGPARDAAVEWANERIAAGAGRDGGPGPAPALVPGGANPGSLVGADRGDERPEPGAQHAASIRDQS